jgi:Uma2 family endonuclease
MENKKDILDTEKKLILENGYLKSKIAYSLGALETINYLLKNDNELIIEQNMEHLRLTVHRILEDLKKEV